MAVSLRRFREQVAALDVVDEAELDSLCKKIAELPVKKQAEQLARALVRGKKLTAYQAQQIYAGKGNALLLGNYLVLDKLGQGGMGMVLKAIHRRMDRIVAIKILSPAIVETPEALSRFQREVKAAARLEHPHIVTAYDADESNGTHFLVMQYVEGQDLSTMVRQKGTLDVSKALACIVQAARGLEFAHSRGVIHRDIKPANILLDHEGTVQILDMGLARFEADDVQESAQLTGTGQIMGTVDYMAPEQAVDTRTVDARADIYSLGVTLWYTLTGRALYDGDSIVKKLMAHQTKPIPSLRESCPQVSQQLDEVFSMMVAKSPETRYQSMTDAIADLESCVSTDATAPSLIAARGELTRFDDMLHEDGSDTQQVDIPTIAFAGAIDATQGDTQIAPTIALSSSEVETDPSAVRVEPRKPALPVKRKSALPKWAKYAIAGVPSLLLIVFVAILFSGKDAVVKQEIATADTGDSITSSSIPTNDNIAWTDLFDGKDLSHWSTLGPFELVGGLLVANGGRANAITKEEFSDFELEAEWKLGPKGNGGIYYRELPTTKVGPGNEYQICDDAAYRDINPPNRQTGSLYGVISPASSAAKPIGDWNKSRIICHGTVVEHWLNGQRLLTYDTSSEDWKNATNFAIIGGGDGQLGVRTKGHILLQGHTGEVAFRMIRIRPINSSTKP